MPIKEGPVGIPFSILVAGCLVGAGCGCAVGGKQEAARSFALLALAQMAIAAGVKYLF